MFYRKNMGTKQALARLIGGCLMILGGVIGLEASLPGLLLAGAGATAMLTGAVGYCPMCALVGLGDRTPPAP